MLKLQLHLHLLLGVDVVGVDSGGGGPPFGHLLPGPDGDSADSGVDGHVLVSCLDWCQSLVHLVSQLGHPPSTSCRLYTLSCLLLSSSSLPSSCQSLP